ncbi:hypothetical protein ACINWC323_2676 [Acinetobacter sp. WC-323]|uniref:hypothetical protein n=1 Tax=Acinetobacter sp. WC-323 TaxID=903918 RepID=UPI00029E24E7|nr:hypothetical protein [Acinetobacter sp. WC-323]EKU56526.1 hypothetical protein ACINWC323_2676 [Acinetobacter sp. WC-323]
MDIDWVRTQRSHFDQLMKEKIAVHQITFGISLLPDHKVGAMIDCAGFASIERIPQDKKILLEKIEQLEAENKALKQKLVMQFLEYKGVNK